MAGDRPDDVVGLDDVVLTGDEASDALARGRALYTAGRLPEAAAAFAEALGADERSAEAHLGLGKALRLAEPARAREALERAVALRAGYHEAWRALALLCRAQGDGAAAERAAASAAGTAPSAAAREALTRDLAGVIRRG